MSYYGFNPNPHALRVGITRDFDSKWYADEVQNTLVPKKEISTLEVDKCYRLESNGHRICINSGLLYRKIRLEKMMGKVLYRDVRSKVKTFRR